MKKERIEITTNNNYMNFYLVFNGQKHWLFSQEYTSSVFEYFRHGKSINELRNFKNWRSNPRLSKTVERIPAMVTYIRKEYELPVNEGKRRYYQSTYRDMHAM